MIQQFYFLTCNARYALSFDDFTDNSVFNCYNINFLVVIRDSSF